MVRAPLSEAPAAPLQLFSSTKIGLCHLLSPVLYCPDMQPKPSIGRVIARAISAQKRNAQFQSSTAFTRRFSHNTPQHASACLFRASRPLYFAASPGERPALKRTPLFDLHVSNGGTMVDFGGYEMPLEYKGMGISDTALWTRSKASIFDVSHM